MSKAGIFSPVRLLRMKNSLEDQGLAISPTSAMAGDASVACGSRVLGSGAGEGNSICGCPAALGCTGLGRNPQRTPKKARRSTARMLITSLAGGLPLEERGGAGETPGGCGIAVLKRSDGGWSVIASCSFYTQKTKREQSQGKLLSSCRGEAEVLENVSRSNKNAIQRRPDGILSKQRP